MKLLIIAISTLFMFCLMDPIEEGDLEKMKTFEFISGTYLQFDPHSWGNDTAWWTFFKDDDICSVYCAIKIKVVNDSGYMPVKHDRGSFIMTDDTSAQMLLYQRVRIMNPPRGYQPTYDPLFMDEFRVYHWEPDSFYMKSTCYSGVIFEGAEWNGKSLLDPTHQAYTEPDIWGR